MTTSRYIPWARISIEGIAIVASILLAFAIDAWWDERQNRATEQRELRRLQVEFQFNHDRNQGSSGARGAARDSSMQVYEALVLARDSGETTLEFAASIFDSIISVPTFDIPTPVLDGLIRSGRIEVIESPEFLEALSLWERAAENLGEMELRARQHFDDHVAPVLLRNAGMSDVFVNHWPLRPDRSQRLAGKVTINVDDEVIALMAQRVQTTAMAARALDSLARADERVLLAIADSLED